MQALLRLHQRGPLAALRPTPSAALFPYLPQQPGYNKRLRAAGRHAALADPGAGHRHQVWADDMWLVDSTPVECGRSRETAQRSDLAGWAGYGYCAIALPLLLGAAAAPGVHPAGLPIAFALASPKADEREVLPATCSRPNPALLAGRSRPDHHRRQGLLRPRVRGRPRRPRRSRCSAPPARARRPRAGAALLQAAPPDHRVGQRHPQRPARPRTPRRPHRAGVCVRVLQRLLALTAAIWHNDHTGQPTPRSLTAYDH